MDGTIPMSQKWPLFLSTITFFTFFFFLLKNYSNKQKPSSPPSPPSFPIIGNLHQLGSFPHRSLHSLSEKYGPLMLLHFGSTPTLVVSSAEASHEVLKTHDLIFASRPYSSMAKRLMYDCVDLAFAPYGEYWRQVRRISVMHLLSIKRVRSFRSVREEQVSIFINKIRECSNVEGSVNLSELIMSVTNGIVCRVALGRRYERDFGEVLDEFVKLLGSFPVGDFIPWLRWVDVLRGLDARARRVFRRLDGFLEGVVDEHQRRQGEKTKCEGEESDFVDVLLSLDDEEGVVLGRDNIKAIILDMFIGGTDTTFTAIEWAMAELIKNPQIMKKTQEEVRQIASLGGNLTDETIDKMKYLKAVIKEALRLHPPLPLLVPHESTQDVRLQGYHIPAGAQVIVNAWAIGREPRSWDRPDEFHPDRFLESEVDFRGQDYGLIPFGAGRRGCPGIGFAVAAIELILAQMLLHFDWDLPDGMRKEELDMSELHGIAVHKRTSLVLVAKPGQIPSL